MSDYRSSYAVDKDGADQIVSGTESTVITASRALWDFNGDYALESSEWTAPVDGIWSANGTVTIKEIAGCTRIAVELWRNGALWFTVAQKDLQPGEANCALAYACDMDCYYTNAHVFDLRLRLEGTEPSCVISGSEDDTAWGASLLYLLNQASPTG